MGVRTGQMDVALTRAGHLEVAFPAERIAGIRRADGTEDGIPRLSLAACLGVAAPGASKAVSYLQVFDDEGGFELGVDSKVKIRSVELANLYRLPTLVRGLGPRTGISGLIELEHELVFFIDLDVMAQWVQREQQG